MITKTLTPFSGVKPFAIMARRLGMDALEAGVVDGNAIGGLLIEVFGAEMTTAVGTCARCRAVGQVAEMAVYRPGLGTVVRCRSCDNVLMVFVEVRGVTCVDLMGLASLS